MKILLTGANGQLGKELQRRLRGTDYLATDVSEMDITNQLVTSNIIASYKPDLVIHGAAYTNVDGAESNADLAYRINAIGTQNIALACLKCDAKLVYISTDYVFDGTLGRAYNEFDIPNPISVYGKSKLAGEKLAKYILNRLYIIRTSWLYGDGNNFVRTILKMGLQKDELKIVNDQYGCPTSTADLVNLILQLIETDCYGVYHATNLGITTWHTFAQKIFELVGNKTVKITPITTAELGRPALRPLYSPLDNMMLRLTFGQTMKPWEEALAEYMSIKSNIVFY